jgi:hypothetical protein
LAKVGCSKRCAAKAAKYIKDRIELEDLLVRFVKEVKSTLHAPFEQANSKTSRVRDDLLGYVGRVWTTIASGDIESAVTEQTSILEKLEFFRRIQAMMNNTIVPGPELALPRGLIGGPVPNRRCLSGAMLAGATMPNGAPVCLPVTGFLDSLPVKCADFGLVPNTVLKTLGDKDFGNLCKKSGGGGHCEYIRFRDDGNPGLCLPLSSHIKSDGTPLTLSSELHLVGGVVEDAGCKSGYARAGTFDPSRSGPHCVNGPKRLNNPGVRGIGSVAMSKESKVGDSTVMSKQEASVLRGGDDAGMTSTMPGMEARKSCTRRHDARLHGIEALKAQIRATRTECNKLKAAFREKFGDKTKKKKKACCDPLPESTEEERDIRSCEAAMVKMIQRREAMNEDITTCALELHNSQCDTISPERRCGKKPWCTEKQVDLLSRVAEGTPEDCCNSYSCVSLGFGDGKENMIEPPALKTMSACPDFSSVSPLKSLKTAGVGEEILKAYGVACRAVEGCLYLARSNTCV